MMKKKISLCIILSTITVLAFSQPSARHWNNFYIHQFLKQSDGELYYGFNFPDKNKSLKYPLMVWVSYVESKDINLPILWERELNNDNWISINPYLENKQISTSENKAKTVKHLVRLIDIFSSREDVYENSIVISGYNEPGLLVLELCKTLRKPFKKAIIFIDDLNLFGKCYHLENVFFVIPKEFENKAIELSVRYYIINKISKKEIKKLYKRM